MNMRLILQGQIAGIKQREFDGKKSTTLQFMSEVEGEISLTEVKLHEEDRRTFNKGDNANLVVTCSTTGNSRVIYYKTVPEHLGGKLETK